MTQNIILFFQNLLYILFTNQKYKDETVYNTLLELKKISKQQQMLEIELQAQLTNIKLDLLKLQITNLPIIVADKFVDEIKYIRNSKELPIFPYKQIKSIDYINAEIDSITNMPYVLHNNKKLFFPEIWTVEQARKMYRNYIEVENLIGGNYTEKSPHQYQTEKFCVQQNDVVYDIGAAEGLFSLDIIEKANHVYIIEPMDLWQKPLQATFEPYKEKVTIIKKFVSNISSNEHVRLQELLEENIKESIFLKMDIEGYEFSVLKDSQEVLNLINHIKIACCTYHNQNDARLLEALFKKLQFTYHFSDGYMLFLYDTNQQEPYFRHGLIRSQK